MTEAVTFQNVEARPIAAVLRSTTWEALSATILSGLDEVWAHLRTAPPAGTGQNVVIYRNQVEAVEIGVQVAPPFTPSARVRLSSTPGGFVAKFLHRGSYSRLRSSHQLVRDTCSAQHRPLIGPCWEVYGDWTPKEEDLLTEVFYLVGTPEENRAA